MKLLVKSAIFFSLAFLSLQNPGYSAPSKSSWASRKASKTTPLEKYLESLGFTLSPTNSTSREYTSLTNGSRRVSHSGRNRTTASKILMIGLDTGLTAENFLINDGSLQTLVTFDSGAEPYTQSAANYLRKYYPKIFSFTLGDPTTTVPSYAMQNPSQKFDLILINGSSELAQTMQDILNCEGFATNDTTIWISGADNDSVSQAIQNCVNMRIIRVNTKSSAKNPEFSSKWVSATYL